MSFANRSVTNDKTMPPRSRGGSAPPPSLYVGPWQELALSRAIASSRARIAVACEAQVAQEASSASLRGAEAGERLARALTEAVQEPEPEREAALVRAVAANAAVMAADAVLRPSSIPQAPLIGCWVAVGRDTVSFFAPWPRRRATQHSRRERRAPGAGS